MKAKEQGSGETLGHQFRQKLQHISSGASQEITKPTFISKVQRFSSPSPHLSPGPGTYQPKIPDKHTTDFRNTPLTRQNSLQRTSSIPTHHAWIGSNRLSFVLPQTHQCPLGPGQYNESTIDSSSENHHHSSWAKGSRFQTVKQFQNKLGPGDYQTEQEKKKKDKIQFVFKSRAARTFIEEIINQGSKGPQQQSKSKNPEDDEAEEVIRFDEASYQVRRKVENKSPMFMSKSKRPQLRNQLSPEKVGPGSYSLDIMGPSRSTTLKPRSNSMHHQLAPLESSQKQPINSELGPGSYEISQAKSSDRFGKRQPFGFIAKAQRFQSLNQRRKNNQMPGPGEYMKKRFSLINEEDVRLKNKGSFTRKAQKVHAFGTAPRSTLRNGSQVPFGQYEVKNYNIEHRLQKQRQNNQKLRMMEVTLPAFNTKRH